MAETLRTIAATLATMAPEASFSSEALAIGGVPTVTPQDVRDAITSLTPSVGALYFATPAATAIAAGGTPLKAAGTTAALGTATADMTVATTNRLTYTGAATRTFLVMATVRLICAADAKVLGLRLYAHATGGTAAAITGGAITYTHVTAAAGDAVSVNALVTLSTSGFVELWVSNETDAEDVTVSLGQLVAVGLPT